jgi:hypothetical protein
MQRLSRIVMPTGPKGQKCPADVNAGTTFEKAVKELRWAIELRPCMR